MAMYQITVGLILTAVFALVWYGLNAAVQATIEVMLADYEAYYPVTTTNFVINFWTYMPILVISATLLWVYVYSQKEAKEAMYYG